MTYRHDHRCPHCHGDITDIVEGETRAQALSDAGDWFEYTQENTELSNRLAEYERLKHELNRALHPNGDGPTNPSMCDLVAFVRRELIKRANTP